MFVDCREPLFHLYIIQQGIIMPGLIDNTIYIFPRVELSVAHSVQEIFARQNYSFVGDDFELPAMDTDDLSDQFQKKLYHTVLKPYSERAKGGYIAAFFAAYTVDDFNKLKTYHSLFYQALRVINTRLSSSSSNYELQLNLINLCLFSALVDMAIALPWHKEARSLWGATTRSSDFSYNLKPLSMLGDGRLQINSLQGKLMATIARAERSEASEREQRELIAELRLTIVQIRAESAASAALARSNGDALARVEALFLQQRQGPEARPEAGPEAGPEARPEARPEAGPEAGPEARPEARPVAEPEARPEAGARPGPEARPEQERPARRPWYAMFGRARVPEATVFPEPRAAHR